MLKQLTRSTGTISFPPLSSLDHPRLPKVSFVRLELDLEIRGSNFAEGLKVESRQIGKVREAGRDERRESEGKEGWEGRGRQRDRGHIKYNCIGWRHPLSR